MTLRAVIFDLDDTLIDWSGFHGDWYLMEQPHLVGVVEHIRECGHLPDDLDFDRFVEEFHAQTERAWHYANQSLDAPHLGRILVSAAEKLGVPAGTLDVEACLRAYAWVAPQGTLAFPEVVEVLPMFKAAGLRVGIVTNAYQPMWLRDIEMQHHGLFDFFVDCRLSAADVGVLKPHPRIFQAALDCLGVNADEAVFVGDDAEADVFGAQAVGIRAVLRKTRRFREPMRLVPDAVIDSLHDLLPLLDGWFPGWRLNVSEAATEN